MATKYLDKTGLQEVATKVKELIPSKTSDLTNDSGFVTSDSKVTQTYTTTSANYPILMKNASGITSTTSPTATSRYGNKIYGNPSTGALYATEFYRNGTSLGNASVKGVDTSISASSTSTNLPTSKAVATFVEGKGYKTTDTTYSFATGSTNGTISVTPSGGSAQSVSVKGLAGAAYKAVDTTISSTTSTNLPTSKAVASYIETLYEVVDTW